MSLGSYFMGDKMVLSMHGAKLATQAEFPEYFSVTHDLARKAGLPMPKLYIIQSSGQNAFATGRDPNHSVVCATTGILQTLNREELAGVLGHELSHVKNRDILLMTVVSILLGLFSSSINMARYGSIFGSNRNREDNNNPIFGLLSVFLIIFAPIFATLIQLAISRQREFLADASSAALTHDPEGLISALKKISQDPTEFTQAQSATASMYIVNPFSSSKLMNLFSTHPPISDRIQALRQME
jgi:heat shock protein HtpX